MHNNDAPTILALYPDLSDAERTCVESNLEQYLMLVLRIHERIQNDPDAYARFRALTEKLHAVSCEVLNGCSPNRSTNP